MHELVLGREHVKARKDIRSMEEIDTAERTKTVEEGAGIGGAMQKAFRQTLFLSIRA